MDNLYDLSQGKQIYIKKKPLQVNHLILPSNSFCRTNYSFTSQRHEISLSLKIYISLKYFLTIILIIANFHSFEQSTYPPLHTFPFFCQKKDTYTKIGHIQEEIFVHYLLNLIILLFMREIAQAQNNRDFFLSVCLFLNLVSI